ncbi:MAG: hypothetical protein ABI425_05080 [Patescibacteria group bacterium]
MPAESCPHLVPPNLSNIEKRMHELQKAFNDGQLLEYLLNFTKFHRSLEVYLLRDEVKKRIKNIRAEELTELMVEISKLMNEEAASDRNIQ